MTQTLEQTVRQTIDEAYNQALDHAIQTVVNHYIAGHSVVSPVLDSIITQLKKLKS